jgi:hypothetical protein
MTSSPKTVNVRLLSISRTMLLTRAVTVILALAPLVVLQPQTSPLPLVLPPELMVQAILLPRSGTSLHFLTPLGRVLLGNHFSPSFWNGVLQLTRVRLNPISKPILRTFLILTRSLLGMHCRTDVERRVNHLQSSLVIPRLLVLPMMRLVLVKTIPPLTQTRRAIL